MHSEPASDHKLGEHRQTRYRRGAASAVSSFRINNLGRSTVSKNKRSRTVFAKKSSIVATEVALALMAAQVAYAQQPVQTAERVERIEITGSRLPQLEVEGASPVTVLTAQDIRMDGLAKTEDLLNNLPQVYAAQGSNASNAATGTAQVNLRGLGPTRNLVLLNGRRLPPGSPDTGSTSNYAADLNQIPV